MKNCDFGLENGTGEVQKKGTGTNCGSGEGGGSGVGGENRILKGLIK